MLAINATTGAQVWSYYEYWTRLPLGAPAIANGCMYDGGNRVYAWKAATGAVAWATSSLGSWVEFSPVFGNDVLYTNPYDYGLYALNPMSGTVIWAEPTYGGSTFGVDMLIGGTSS